MGDDDEVGDAELAAGFQRDPERFQLVYDRYRRDIFHYVAGRLDRQDADDVTAETFLVAFRILDRYDPARGALRPWLFGIATNCVAEHRRKEARHYRAMSRGWRESPVESHENRVAAVVTAHRAKSQLAKALLELTPGERDVLLLVALGQLTHEEVAQALDISYGTVGSRLSRGRAKLRQVIDQEALNG
ncbi:RNA polymerase sigma factor [Actinomadura rubrisoli]|uniref:RNA polymerase sigma factor n=1 Tax=Actinomadura rubrisoli TaxID=2530368 RepID=A0A4R5A3P4_9ACTN|nr:RNA polymerase sigma factor [Actinomadura rubrisoli]TDD66558.1 RNA polymerase sigma factor [Actinomadura rubrisoli]